VPLARSADHDPALIDLLAGARFALLGEASHGSDDFYRERAAITRRLIVERGLDAVAVEADWPDAYRVNRYVRGLGDDASGAEALADFKRFPAWMWRNTSSSSSSNGCASTTPSARPRHASASTASTCTACSRRSKPSSPTSTAPTPRRRGAPATATPASTASPRTARRTATRRASSSTRAARSGRRAAARDGRARRRVSRGLADGDADASFHAEQNARLVKNAEEYYRSMFSSRVSSWNLRDRHMAETLAELDGHLSRQRGRPARIAVWAHNSHLGDARATEMGEAAS
jgi:erythromycin esterase-like protein